MRWALAPGVLAPGVVAVAALMRSAIFVSSGSVTFDEGVYGASVLAMRDGAAPFRDVFSSQGPLFLPLLRLFDLIGLGHVQALRLVMVLSAVAITLGVLAIARRVAPPAAGLIAALVVATSGTVLRAAGPVQSDGVALALSVGAVAVAMGAGSLGDRTRWIVTGLLLGAGVAVKSLFVLPAVLAVVWLFGADRRWGRVVGTGAVAAGVVLAASVPWGLANVWDQNVTFQLMIPRSRNPLANAADVAVVLGRREAMVVGLLLLAGVAAALARRWARPQVVGELRHRQAVGWWLAAVVVVLVLGVGAGGGYERYLAFLVVPAALAVAALRPPARLATIVAVALLPVVLLQNLEVVDGRRLQREAAEATAVLAELPEGGLVVSDEPGLPWVVERHPPPDLADMSWARLQAGYLTAADVLGGVTDPQVCAVVLASGRFDWLDPDLEAHLTGFVTRYEWEDGRRRVLVRPDCG